MTKTFFSTLVFAAFAHFGFTQIVTQTIRGIIFDKQSLTPLIGANVIITGSDPLKAATSDENGNFRLDGITSGRYDLKITYVSYKEQLIPNVLVTNGKEVVLEIGLEETVDLLQTVVINGSKKSETINEMTTVSGRSFSMEEVNRYSGGIGDPARLAANFAGVNTANDQRNDLIIRGNSPTGVLWRVDGMNVPNLNHFAVLGTTGGPVSALNTNTLKNSDFITSAFASEYGNALAGVFDIGFRKGNTEKREHTFQFGAFTGLEYMTEGPIDKKSGASYMAAYRYSFTGLAQAAGFSIGTAANPDYQDIIFKLQSGKTRWGTFSLFGLGGKSSIDFLHDKIDSSDVFADPTRDSYSRSKLGLVGISHLLQLSSNTHLKTIVGANYSENSFDSDTVSSQNIPFRIIKLSSKDIRSTINSSLTYKMNSKLTLKTGIVFEKINLKLNFDTRDLTPDWQTKWDYDNTMGLFQEYAQAKYSFSNKLWVTGGIHFQQLTLNSSSSVEPRFALKLLTTPKSNFSVGYGWHEQIQPSTVYFYQITESNGAVNQNNRNLQFSRAQHFVLGYEFLPINDWRVKTEIYYQALQKIPVTTQKNSFSLLNEGNAFVPTQRANLSNTGVGSNYGIELTIEKFFSKGYYGLLTSSLYQSKYKGSDGVERNTAFNGRYTFNFLCGKEIKIGKNSQHAITFDTKVTAAGGRYYTPVDLERSIIAREEVLKSDEFAFSDKLPDYFRFDFKIGFRYNSSKKRLSHSLFVDFQNLTNHKNVFARQFNKLNNQINTTYQNGFLPNFIYRINF